MKKIRCIIADDEELALSILKEYISRIDQLELVAVCNNGAEVFNFLLQNPADLLFLDIRMPQLSGMELLKVAPPRPAVILTTAYSEFALEAYGFNVIDYLLKPVSFERFAQSVRKYALLAGLPVFDAPSPEMSQPSFPSSFMYVRSDKKMVKVSFDEILFIEGLKDYVRINLLNRSVITYQTLQVLEEKLPEPLFLRVHRSFIVSVAHITAYTAKNVEVGQTEIPIGDSYAAKVIARLTVFNGGGPAIL